MTPSEERIGEAVDLEELTAQRERLVEWLSRLDDASGRAPRHVLDRVREDYQTRLRRLDQHLSQHRTSLRTEMQNRSSLLRDAQDRHGALTDEHAELDLRRMVGEVAGEEWDARGTALQQAIAETEAELSELREEVARIDALLRNLEAKDAAASIASELPEDATVELPPEPTPQAPGRSFNEEWLIGTDFDSAEAADGPYPEHSADESLPPFVSAGTLHGAPAPQRDGDAGDADRGDLAFLEELDRAIAASSDPTASLDELREDEAAPPVAQPGRKCPECGYTNPLNVRRCEMCDTGMP